MKRIIYSCIFFLSLFLTSKLDAQVWTATVTPNACLYPGIPYVGNAGNQTPNAAATGYTWTIIDPAGNPVTSYSVVSGTPLPAEQITFTLSGASGCGTYSIQMYALNNGVPIPGQVRLLPVTLYCQPTVAITASSPSICAGQSTSLTLNGTPFVLWNPGGSNANPYLVSPLATTCYTAVGTTANGCTNQAVSCVTVQNVNVSIAPPSQTICPTITSTLTALGGPGYTYQWFQTSPGLVPLGTGTTQTVTPAANSTYSVNAFFNTCQASATASIVIGGSLSVFVSPSSPSVCPAESVTLTAFSSATSYTWAGPGIPGFPGNNANPIVGSGPGLYTVSARNGACFGATIVPIGLTAFTPTISSSSPSVCPGETFTLTGTGGVIGSTTYTWAYQAPPVSGPVLPLLPYVPGPSTISITQTVATVYGFAVTSPAGCTNSVSTLVGITPNVTVTAAVSSNSVCAGSQVTLSANGNGVSSYTWTSPLGVVGTGSVIVTNPLVATVYSVSGSNAAGFCTSAPATVAVNMVTNGALSLTLTSNVATVCPQQAANLSATTTVINANYSWTPTLTLVGSTTGASVVAAPDASTIYSVTVNNGGGCTGTGTISLAVTPIPTVTAFASSTAVCAGFTSTLTASGAASYTWMGSTFSLPVNQQTISVSPGPNSLTPATYTVIGAPSAGNCVSAPFYISISLAPDLVLLTTQNHYTTCITTNANAQNPYKLSKPVDFTVDGATDYSWFPNTQPYMTYSVGPATTVRPPTSTCYTVVGSTQVCSGTATLCVTVIPQFTMNVVPLSPVMCIGDSMNLSIANVGTLAVGPASNFTYNWTEAANAPPPSLNFYGTPSVTAYPQNTTTYTVEMKDSRACASLPRLTTVTVLPVPITAIAIPTINNVPTNTLCFVGDIPGAPDNLLDLTAYNGNTGLPFGIAPTYTWDSPYFPESFVTSRYAATVKIKAPTRLPAVVIYTVVTGYNGVTGCKSIDTITVRVIDCRPIIQSNVLFNTDIEKDTLCARECITYFALTDTMAGGPQTYSWTFKGGSPPTSTLSTPAVCYNLSGEHDVILKVSNPYPKYTNTPGSSATVAFRKYIKVVDIPNVTIVPPGQRASDTTIRYGQSVALTGTNALTYNWSPHYNITSTTDPNVTVSPFKSTTYVLTGFNSNRCFSSDTINVIVIQDCGDMFVPNAFSPNGDGVNDELKVNGACLQTLTFMIFNRWGEKVFETTDVNVGWDGTYHGDKLNTGVFVYRLEGKTIEGKGYSSKGNITLIR